jgi:spermidine/putrescine transport system ATP-binding protein
LEGGLGWRILSRIRKAESRRIEPRFYPAIKPAVPPPIVEFKSITKSYPGQPVLADFSLDIIEGEFLTLLGPSGCGKTTLLRLLAGFETPEQGQILLDGECVNHLPPDRRNVNTVFQSYALFPHLSVFDNVAFGLKMKKLARQAIQEQVAVALSAVQLADYGERRPGQLSGGQQQRVALARALVNRPRVLLLDEPLSALDYKLRRAMQVELKTLQRRVGTTFIFVTHDQEEALSLSDRVVVLRGGVIEQIGGPREIYENPASRFVAEFVGEANFLDGVVSVRLNETSAFALVEGAAYELRCAASFGPDARFCLMLRPEDLRLVNPEATEARLQGRLTEKVYKGSTLDVGIELDSGKRLIASAIFDPEDPAQASRPGQRVGLSWIAGREKVFPA